jgi:hypothetical protein
MAMARADSLVTHLPVALAFSTDCRLIVSVVGPPGLAFIGGLRIAQAAAAMTTRPDLAIATLHLINTVTRTVPAANQPDPPPPGRR